MIADLGLKVNENGLATQVLAAATVDTSIIEIAVTDTNAVRASDIANHISLSLSKVVGQIDTSDSNSVVTPVQEATVPQTTGTPKIPLNIALGALIGLAIAVGVSVLRETLETRIRNEHDVEQVSEMPILGVIGFDPKAKNRPLIVQVDPRSPRAESFRTLHTNLQFLEADRAHRSFVITSSVESEGKSTTAANLAIAPADAGSRVLLVDADLRRPKLAEYMGLEGAVGLTDALIGRADLTDVIQPWGKNKLYFLPAGSIPPNPSELLGSARMETILKEFNRSFNVVIFDTPPLLPVTDAAILAKKVGGARIDRRCRSNAQEPVTRGDSHSGERGGSDLGPRSHNAADTGTGCLRLWSLRVCLRGWPEWRVHPGREQERDEESGQARGRA